MILYLKEYDATELVKGGLPGSQAFLIFGIPTLIDTLLQEYDATELVKGYQGPKPAILIDQGTADTFLKDPDQLKPESFASAAAAVGYPVQVRMCG